jgi:hypothetical protein
MAEKRECQIVYSDELAREICERVAEGGKLAEICAEPGMPAKSTFHRWLARHPELMEMYSRARRARAFLRADEIDAITAKVLAGEIDPNAGRVAIQAHQWLASREDPKGFGEQTTTKMNLSAAPAAESPSVTAQWLESLFQELEGPAPSVPLPLPGEVKAITGPLAAQDGQ